MFNGTGDMAEVLFKTLLKEAGFSIEAYKSFSSEKEIMEAFETFNPIYYRSAMAHWEGGKKKLIDHLGIDFVLQDQGLFLGLDVTVKGNALLKKRYRCRENAEVWEYLGLKKAAVVFIDYSGSHYNLPHFSELPETIQDKLLNQIYDYVDHLKGKEGGWGDLLTLEYPTYDEFQ